MIVLTYPDGLDAPPTPAGEVDVVLVHGLSLEVVYSFSKSVSLLFCFWESGLGVGSIVIRLVILTAEIRCQKRRGHVPSELRLRVEIDVDFVAPARIARESTTTSFFEGRRKPRESCNPQIDITRFLAGVGYPVHDTLTFVASKSESLPFDVGVHSGHASVDELGPTCVARVALADVGAPPEARAFFGGEQETPIKGHLVDPRPSRPGPAGSAGIAC
jgi:hypothetical protein